MPKTRVIKNFFWRDKSGRGFNNNFNQSELVKAFRGEKNDDGVSVTAWVNYAEVGDVWSNNANVITRTQ